ncbi:MAG: ABC transporter ATP-binding protein [Herpetosiphonaceae bacterium]|nr:ABC transporter ATP-binding protein [Herpetosiphonaceae bacterium]
MSNTDIPALEVRDITKQFPGVLANDHVSFTLMPGEIHAFLGENGAGKSTLMNILYGLYDPDEGEILIDGQLVKIKNSADAIRMGLGMVHQEYALVDTLTVTENIMLGTEMHNGPLLDSRRASQRVKALSEQYGLKVPPDAIVGELPVGVQQRVEILKALYRNVRMLILDEPTAVLTPQEADDLFRVMKEFAAQGKSIIFITHKLREVLAIADRITVLRRGRVVGTALPAESTDRSLAAMMVGREVVLQVEKKPASPGAVVLAVDGLTVRDDRGLTLLNNVSLEVRAGEVLGIAGVQGNGQTELVEAITGLQAIASGQVRLLEQDITSRSPRTITEQGVAYIPEDRKGTGLVLSYSITDNMVLSSYYKPPFASGLTMNEQAIRANAEKLIKTFDVRTPSADTRAGSLSGGNQQKIIVAREFTRDNKLLIAAQPTRGIDVGSIEFIHRSIISQRDSGVAVLLVSAELDEVLSLADRIAVMYHGEIMATLPAAEATRERIGLLMAGVQQEPANA